jgi:hypothetical protein
MENHSSELGLAGAFGAEVMLEVLTVVQYRVEYRGNVHSAVCACMVLL